MLNLCEGRGMMYCGEMREIYFGEKESEKKSEKKSEIVYGIFEGFQYD